MLLSKIFRPTRVAARAEFSLRLFSTPVISNDEQIDINAPAIQKKIKHKVPQKRASSLLHILKNEEFEALRNGRVYPNIHSGDSVEIEKLLYMSSKEPVKIRGVVIGKFNKLSDTSLMLLNVENGTSVIRRIPMYNPLVQSIKIIQKAFLHNGKKRVRRSKLYYLTSRDPEEYTVK